MAREVRKAGLGQGADFEFSELSCASDSVLILEAIPSLLYRKSNKPKKQTNNKQKK